MQVTAKEVLGENNMLTCLRCRHAQDASLHYNLFVLELRNEEEYPDSKLIESVLNVIYITTIFEKMFCKASSSRFYFLFRM